ncbi:MAG: SEC-C metal-binding domain-containing protein [Clostridia bacterium]|nr:SEC-C metal-binding domain-containing protein [Clostridia bacterium]
MSLYREWEKACEESNVQNNRQFWVDYLEKEKDIYAEILDTEEVIEGELSELAAKFGLEAKFFTGFVDGINDSLKVPYDLDSLEETSEIKLDYDEEKLYYNMVAAKAEWLYSLPQWDKHLTAERRKELYKQQRSSTTIVKGEKIGRNDPCPCGSGKKYKKCCGRNA